MTPIDLPEVLERRLAEINPVANTVVTTCFDRVRAEATRLLKQPVEARRALCGLPVAIKTPDPVSGVRTTFGLLVYKDWIPDCSNNLVKRVRHRGGLVYCKTNSPEVRGRRTGLLLPPATSIGLSSSAAHHNIRGITPHTGSAH